RRSDGAPFEHRAPLHASACAVTSVSIGGRHLRKRRRRATITRIIPNSHGQPHAHIHRPNSHGQPHAHIHRRCRTMRPIAILALSAAMLPACGAGGQDAEEAAFVTRLGDDTVAVERFTRSPTGIRAEVALRSPRTSLRVYDLLFDESGRPATMTVETYDPATGFSGEPSERQEIELSEGSGIPFIDMVHWPFELMLDQIHSSSEDSVTVELV